MLGNLYDHALYHALYRALNHVHAPFLLEMTAVLILGVQEQFEIVLQVQLGQWTSHFHLCHVS